MMVQAPTCQIFYTEPAFCTHYTPYLTYFSAFVRKGYTYSQHLSWDLMISNHQEMTFKFVNTRSKLVIFELFIYSVNFFIFIIRQSPQGYTYSQYLSWDLMISNHQEMNLKPISSRSKLVISKLFIYSIIFYIFTISQSFLAHAWTKWYVVLIKVFNLQKAVTPLIHLTSKTIVVANLQACMHSQWWQTVYAATESVQRIGCNGLNVIQDCSNPGFSVPKKPDFDHTCAAQSIIQSCSIKWTW